MTIWWMILLTEFISSRSTSVVDFHPEGVLDAHQHLDGRHRIQEPGLEQVDVAFLVDHLVVADLRQKLQGPLLNLFLGHALHPSSSQNASGSSRTGTFGRPPSFSMTDRWYHEPCGRSTGTRPAAQRLHGRERYLRPMSKPSSRARSPSPLREARRQHPQRATQTPAPHRAVAHDAAAKQSAAPRHQTALAAQDAGLAGEREAESYDAAA